MDKELKKDLKRQANELKAQFNIGKNGLTSTFFETIDKYLDAHSIVKIKSTNMKDKDGVAYFADELAKDLNALIVDKKGFTFVLYRKKSKR